MGKITPTALELPSHALGAAVVSSLMDIIRQTSESIPKRKCHFIFPNDGNKTEICCTRSASHLGRSQTATRDYKAPITTAKCEVLSYSLQLSILLLLNYCTQQNTMHVSALVFVLNLLATTIAHPGEDHAEEAAKHRHLIQHSRRDLSHCESHMRSRGYVDSQIARRRELARTLQLARGLRARDLSDINKSHHSNENYSLETPPETLFGTNNSCILSPEVMEGPYC